MLAVHLGDPAGVSAAGPVRESGPRAWLRTLWEFLCHPEGDGGLSGAGRHHEGCREVGGPALKVCIFFLPRPPWGAASLDQFITVHPLLGSQ